MSAWSNRNLAAMLKEQRASPATMVAPLDKATDGDVPKRPVVSVEPKKPEPPAPAAAGVVAAVSTPTEPVPTSGPASGTEVVYTSIGPVSMPQALAKLVMPSEFRFAGSVEAPKPVATLQPAVTQQPAEAAPKPVAIAPPIPVAVAPAPTVTSSSDLQQSLSQQQHQWNPPQPAYNPPVNDYVHRYQGALPYGGELGSVPRFYSTERQYNAQPYHPTYHTPYYRSSYSSSAIQYDGYGDMYHSHYSGQGAPYMGGRLQAHPPYYPPRDPSLQQRPAAQYN
ncbi:conserved hypothetical protein [Leishmania major strain Friedlin]|uniref:Uncharacterized protein n=1 Tax=Leishmania major TaxID=5664 RepID=Q4QCN2_LEIMA|nr:conserved hypothetical protein [Leishmania major strain Friedlin]CAG9573237.1 hypothetical_protein_-_conserved [Leishmania major strain Friedlin]CAJ04498.1 conserved hypothetical protein [Leishmania major strain Friedlin]|eukprot:XP_001682916.1 conserved hypothetical protein [Leishmania major strain Friedlin]